MSIRIYILTMKYILQRFLSVYRCYMLDNFHSLWFSLFDAHIL